MIQLWFLSGLLSEAMVIVEAAGGKKISPAWHWSGGLFYCAGCLIFLFTPLWPLVGVLLSIDIIHAAFKKKLTTIGANQDARVINSTVCIVILVYWASKYQVF